MQIDKKILIAAFVVLVLVQLFVPARMILNRELVLSEGKVYKFRTAPIDPYDPFRGRYITLRYPENRVGVENENDWQRGENIHVALRVDEEGFARIGNGSREIPASGEGYLKATVKSVSTNGSHQIRITYPFDRYYMEESKAFDAEEVYQDVMGDPEQVAYALVHIKDGVAVLKDVMIDGVSIREIVKARVIEDK